LSDELVKYLLAVLETLPERVALAITQVTPRQQAAFEPFDEAMARLRCGETRLKQLIRSGKLESCKVGRQRVVSVASIDALLAAGAAAATPRRRAGRRPGRLTPGLPAGSGQRLGDAIRALPWK
jgi:hypothetical protein